MQDLNLIIKTDTTGSSEAIAGAIKKLEAKGVRINIIRAMSGGVTEGDVALAVTSTAIILAFNVRPSFEVQKQALESKIEIRVHTVIYDLIEEINKALKGMVKKEYVEKIVGHAEVRKIFKNSKFGTIGGSYVLDGVIPRDAKAVLLRDKKVIYQGTLLSLRRGSDDVKEVKTNFEFGFALKDFNDLQEGDILQAIIQVEKV
jgi:translation initiation factor IF-2